MVDLSFIVDMFLLVMTIIAHRKSNKKISEIISITNILQLDAIFAFWCNFFSAGYFFSPDHIFGTKEYFYNGDALLNHSILYEVLYTLNILLINYHTKLKYPIIPLFLFVTIPLFSLYAGNLLADIHYIQYRFVPGLLLLILSMIICIKRTLRIDKKLKPVNYFYYLLFGFLVLELFYFLSEYKVISFQLSFWMKFLYCYTIYQILFKSIYIFYVLKII